MMNIGMKIQKGGGRYIKDEVSFILFDVKIDKWWLRRPDIEEIAGDLAIKVVPVIGYMTFEEAIEYVSNGYKSLIAEDTTYDAEGLVLKTDLGLLDRSGQRIIAKIKARDFWCFIRCPRARSLPTASNIWPMPTGSTHWSASRTATRSPRAC